MDTTNAPVTPEEIVQLILEEMRAEIAPLYYSNLVRSVYHVHLAPDDLDRLRPVLSRIRDEAVRALNEELVKLNRSREPAIRLPLVKEKKKKRYEAMGEWIVEFHENTDDDARENPLIIQSAFALPKTDDEAAGMLTERITRRAADGQTTSTTRTARVSSGTVYATMEYSDDTGDHEYQMTKDQIKIGRGGVDRWVDLKLMAKKDVSREHVEIRRDPASGRFFIKDLSTLGTTVNGKRVPPSIDREGGSEVDRNVESPLPEKAKIGLAGVLFLEFKAVKSK